MTEEGISELYRSIETMEFEEQKTKGGRKMNRVSETCCTLPVGLWQTDVHVLESQAERRERGRKVFEEIMEKHCPNHFRCIFY